MPRKKAVAPHPPSTDFQGENSTDSGRPPRRGPRPAYKAPDDSLYEQLASVCDWLKLTESKAAYEGDEGQDKARAQLAHRLSGALNTVKRLFARDWAILGPYKGQIAVDLVVAEYCKSRANPDDDLSEVRYNPLGRAITATCWRALVPTAESRSSDLVRLLGNLVHLYEAPLTSEELCRVHVARTRLQPNAVLLRGSNAELPLANQRREASLEAVAAAHAQLSQLPPGHHLIAAETYLTTLSLDQQASVVADVRSFLFEACKQRATKGTLPDPTSLLTTLNSEFSTALVFPQQSSTWLRFNRCLSNLAAVVQFYVEKGASGPIMAPLVELLAWDRQKEWERLFAGVDMALQELAVTQTGAILPWLHSAWAQRPVLPDTYEVEQEFLRVLPKAAQSIRPDHPNQSGAFSSLGHARHCSRPCNGCSRTHAHAAGAFFPVARTRRQ